MSFRAAELTTFREAGRRLGYRTTTISEVVRALGIVPMKHPCIGNAYGLTPDQMKKLERVLRRRAARSA